MIGDPGTVAGVVGPEGEVVVVVELVVINVA